MTRVASRLALTLALAMSAAGCGDDDGGPGIFSPGEGLTGTWVRFEPSNLASDGLTFVPADTLFIGSNGRVGIWSVEVVGFSTGPQRIRSDVVLEPAGVRLFLNFAPCPVCFSGSAGLAELAPPDEARFLSTLAPPHYEVARVGENHLRIQGIVIDPTSAQHYRRVSLSTRN